MLQECVSLYLASGVPLFELLGTLHIVRVDDVKWNGNVPIRYNSDVNCHTIRLLTASSRHSLQKVS